MEHAAGFERDDDAERRLGKLEAILAPSIKDMKHATALLADLLSIGGDRCLARHNAIAQALGFTKPFIYSHFRSKVELLAFICRQALKPASRSRNTR